MSAEVPCPDCQKPSMVTRQIGGLEIDQCQLCEGIWFDARELETVFGVADGSFRVASGAEPSKAQCPRCQQHLYEFVVRGTAVEIDMCSACSGIWLNAKELDWLSSSRTHDVVVELLEESIPDPPAGFGDKFCGFMKKVFA